MVKSKGQMSNTEKVLESPEALREKLALSEDLFSKYKNVIFGALVVVLLAVGAVVFYNYRQNQQNAEAQQAMYPAVFYFEADSLDKALEGDLQNPGLLSIAEEYEGTKAGNLAHFYVGSAYIKKGNYEEAIQNLKDFESDDLLVQARAYSLIGDAYMELGNYGQAVAYYNEAASYKPNAQFTPDYLMKAALAFEMSEDYQGAIGKYNTLINQYPKSQQVNEAKKYKSRAEAIVNQQ